MSSTEHFPNERDDGRNPRDEARAYAQDGLAYLARAFNHCGVDDLAHRYSDAVQARFLELATELVALVERGAIEPNTAHGLHLLRRAARENEPLQSLIRKAERAVHGRTKRRADQ